MNKTIPIIIISLSITVIILFDIFSPFIFPSEHCPGLEMKKLLGQIDPTTACL